MLSRFDMLFPDDMHGHLRQGTMMEQVLALTAQWVARQVVMPNRQPPVLTDIDALG